LISTIFKLHSQDFIEGGLTLNEGKQLGKIVVDTGYATIEVTGGSGDTLLKLEYPKLTRPICSFYK